MLPESLYAVPGMSCLLKVRRFTEESMLSTILTSLDYHKLVAAFLHLFQ